MIFGMRDRPTAEEIVREFPGWQVWLGINRRWYARRPLASPPLVVDGEDLADLRDQVCRAQARLKWGMLP
jgi:hypothetical protein